MAQDRLDRDAIRTCSKREQSGQTVRSAARFLFRKNLAVEVVPPARCGVNRRNYRRGVRRDLRIGWTKARLESRAIAVLPRSPTHSDRERPWTKRCRS